MAERERALNIPPVVLWLAAVLALIYIALEFLPPDLYERALLTFAFIPARYGEAAAVLPGGAAARYWTPLTYAFLHGGIMHLVVNLVWMASFGSAVAQRFGASRFLILSAVSAVAGAAAHYFSRGISYEAVVVGASAAISGMTAATARFAFSPGGPLTGSGQEQRSYYGPATPLSAMLSNRQALSFILVWFAINILFGAQGSLNFLGEGASIAWEAHIGGFLAGFLCFSLLDPPGKDPPAAAL